MVKLIIYGGFLAFFGVLMIIAYREFAGSKSEGKDIFYMTALLVQRKWSMRKKGKNRALISGEKVREQLKALNPGEDVEALKKEYALGKLRLVFIILLSGNVLAIAVCLSNLGSKELSEGRLLPRNGYGGGDKTAIMHVEADGLPFSEDIRIRIMEEEYTDEEAEELFLDLTESMEERIRGDNENLDEVRTDLHLPRSFDNYPFTVTWDSSNCNYMDSSGHIVAKDIDEDGEVVALRCVCKYKEWEGEYSLGIRLLPPVYTEEEVWKNAVESELDAAQQATIHKSNLLLPDVADDTELIWSETDKDESHILLFLTAAAAFLAYQFKDRDLLDRMKKRETQIREDYCPIINRMTLYMTAGMTTRAAFFKIAEDYRRARDETGRKRFAYEEMLMACKEMNNGVSEGAAYENFALRCSCGEYTRLVGLLNQNLKKGNANLLTDMKNESLRAQTERQNSVRKKGEEAGTKLMLPMMMMLGIVMIIIMVPAFMSFAV